MEAFMGAGMQIAEAFVGTLGFAIFFGARRKYWLLISVNGALSWMVYLAGNALWGNFFGNLMSAVFCSLYAYVASKICRTPVTVLLIPSTVPMIPGGSLYYTLSHLLAGDRAGFENYAYITAESIFGMAIGFALVTWLFRMLWKKHTGERTKSV